MRAVKNAECQRIDTFKIWCWRRLFRVPWTAWKSNQSTLKEINPEYSLEGLMLKLKYFGHLMWTADSLENAGKDWRQEKWVTKDETVGWHHWLNGHEFEQTPVDGEGQEGLACCSWWGCKEPDTATEQQGKKEPDSWCLKWQYGKGRGREGRAKEGRGGSGELLLQALPNLLSLGSLPGP